jgi:hypothetical protein
MGLLTIEGTYRDGKIELAEVPAEVSEARVMVIFLPEAGRDEGAGKDGRTEAAQRGERAVAGPDEEGLPPGRRPSVRETRRSL